MTKTVNREELSEKTYWDDTYKNRPALKPLDFSRANSFWARELLALKEKIGIRGKKILEIGGGGSAWLAFLAKAYPTSHFTCLDYSEAGVHSLSTYAFENNLGNIETTIADMFSPLEIEGQFDFVFSHGVVEHFSDLPGVIRAHSKFLKHDGLLLITIPNMAGSLGALTKRLNKKVYDIHVPHDRESLVAGHEDALLEVLESGYICSSNFGVLSSCVTKKPSIVWFVCSALHVLSRFSWYVEERTLPLPKSRAFSPYIYVVSRLQSAPLNDQKLQSAHTRPHAVT